MDAYTDSGSSQARAGWAEQAHAIKHRLHLQVLRKSRHQRRIWRGLLCVYATTSCGLQLVSQSLQDLLAESWQLMCRISRYGSC